MEKRLAVAGAIVGALMVMFGIVGYLLGYNDTPGGITQSNLVPMTLFVGVELLVLSGALVVLQWPERLPRSPGALGIVALSILAFASVALYVKQVKDLIAVRADIVSWAESPFVDNIIRLRAGQPQFTPPADANSFPYSPGSPLLTYAIARAVGHPTSVPVYRMVQQLFLIVATLFVAAATRELFLICLPNDRHRNLWMLFWLPFLYLIATNPLTNIFVHSLHNDTLALTFNAIAFWVLTRHLRTGDNRWLIAMAVLPALAYLSKQKEAIWAVLFLIYLVLERRVVIKRVVAVAVVALAMIGVSAWICYAVWGDPYIFWNFKVLSVLHVSLRKCVEQVTLSGWYIALGLVGGAVVLQGARFRRLFPVWICWVVHLLASVYTSGLAFTPAHLGPATLIGAVWFLVALACIWPGATQEQEGAGRSGPWLRIAAMTFLIFTFFLSSGIVRSGSAVPNGLERYIVEIEKEFAGLPRDRVLLDYGSWVYLPDNIVMKDRGSPIAVMYGAGLSDFYLTPTRIQNRYYDKILWRRVATGELEVTDPKIRRALLENYHEVRIIRSPGIPPTWQYSPLLGDIGVFEPTKAGASEHVAPPSTTLAPPGT